MISTAYSYAVQPMVLERIYSLWLSGISTEVRWPTATIQQPHGFIL